MIPVFPNCSLFLTFIQLFLVKQLRQTRYFALNYVLKSMFSLSLFCSELSNVQYKLSKNYHLWLLLIKKLLS